MANGDELFFAGDAAEDAGDFDLALRFFQEGASLGDVSCLGRLGMMFDVGQGVQVDKSFAMRCYQRAWRRGCGVAASNIAILYREQGSLKATARWFKRAIERGDGDARVELAKCYLNGHGLRRSVGAASLQLKLAVEANNITEAGREEAGNLLKAIDAR